MTKETEDKIKSIIDKSIRPAFQKTGGDIEFFEYNNGVVKVQLKCPAIGCSCISESIKHEVERLLKDEVPEVKCVELQS